MTSSNGENGNGVKVYKKNQSRKWRLALLVLLLATFGTFLPPIISLWILESSKALIILTGTEWVSVITLVVGLYIGGNVYQKHIEGKNLAAGVSFNASVSAVGDAAVAAPHVESGRRPHDHYGRTPANSDLAEPYDENDEGKEA